MTYTFQMNHFDVITFQIQLCCFGRNALWYLSQLIARTTHHSASACATRRTIAFTQAATAVIAAAFEFVERQILNLYIAYL